MAGVMKFERDEGGGEGVVRYYLRLGGNVDKNTDKDILHLNFCPTSFLKGNFRDSMFLSPFTLKLSRTYLIWTITKVAKVFHSHW